MGVKRLLIDDVRAGSRKTMVDERWPLADCCICKL